MDRRLVLDQILKKLIGPDVSLYFQPPDSIKMTYPCLRYEWDSADTQFADDNPYIVKKCYRLMAITRNPDDTLPEKILTLPSAIMERHYTEKNLHHYVFNLYF